MAMGRTARRKADSIRRMSHKTKQARLMIAASEHDADMLYVSGMFVPDAFIAVEISGHWHGLFSPLEVDRARTQSKFHTVHLDVPYRQAAASRGYTGLAAIAAAFLQQAGVRKIIVPEHFSLSHAEQLRGWGFEVVACDGPMFPQRQVKSENEIRHLARAERLTRRAMRQAESFLAACGIGDDGILTAPANAARPGKKVKSEDVRRVIETFLIANGAMPAHTIVASGREAADPHNTGSGYIRAGRLIIIDIFPRILKSGYWGDMTRTYVKGRATPEQKKLYQTVREGQDIGLSMVADGVDGADIHNKILEHFTRSGFPTGMYRGRQQGFFHGTGHGVGLEIHERPRISTQSDILRSGQVVTVEPGLYYPRLGGVRLEDLVVVRNGGCDNLTRYRRRLEVA